MESKCFANVWDALEDTPEAAADMKVRSSLLINLKDVIRGNGWTEAEAARECGLDLETTGELLRGNINLFPMGKLLSIAARLNLELRLAPVPA